VARIVIVLSCPLDLFLFQASLEPLVGVFGVVSRLGIRCRCPRARVVLDVLQVQRALRSALLSFGEVVTGFPIVQLGPASNV
jgi:hypothetical protein